MLAEGADMLMLGAVLSTAKVLLGPAAGAKFPAVSLAVPAAMEIPKAPLPLILSLLAALPISLPDTPIVPVAVPVAFKVMSVPLSVLALKFASAYVTV